MKKVFVIMAYTILLLLMTLNANASGAINFSDKNEIGMELNSFQSMKSNSFALGDLMAFLLDEYDYFSDEFLELESFLEQSLELYSINGWELGLVFLQENFIRANHESVNLYLDYNQGAIYEGLYSIDAVANEYQLYGFYIGGLLYNSNIEERESVFNGQPFYDNNIKSGLNIDYRFKVFYDGDLEYRAFRGDIEVRAPLIYQGGYRSIKVNRSESSAWGYSLDFMVDILIDDDFNIFANGYNLINHVVFNDLYMRDIYGRRGVFSYDDYQIEISDRIETGVNYGNWQGGVDYHKKFYSYINYGFEFGSFEIRPGIYGERFSLGIKSNHLEFDLKSDRVNLLNARNIDLGISVNYSF